MNERMTVFLIQTLGKDGVIEKRAFGHWALSDEEMEKFARAIIRECANIAREADSENVFGAGFGYEIADNIENYFGV